jgi:hypothetical protein
MARYTFDSTPLQELAITELRVKANAVAAVGADPLLPVVDLYPDNKSFVKAQATAWIAPQVAAYVETRLNRVADAFRHDATTDAQRTAVEQALGLP